MKRVTLAKTLSALAAEQRAECDTECCSQRDTHCHLIERCADRRADPDTESNQSAAFHRRRSMEIIC